MFDRTHQAGSESLVPPCCQNEMETYPPPRCFVICTKFTAVSIHFLEVFCVCLYNSSCRFEITYNKGTISQDRLSAACSMAITIALDTRHLDRLIVQTRNEQNYMIYIALYDP
jgi:hypothetical protein